jgi:hypothetical protein
MGEITPLRQTAVEVGCPARQPANADEVLKGHGGRLRARTLVGPIAGRYYRLPEECALRERKLDSFALSPLNNNG